MKLTDNVKVAFFLLLDYFLLAVGLAVSYITYSSNPGKITGIYQLVFLVVFTIVSIKLIFNIKSILISLLALVPTSIFILYHSVLFYSAFSLNSFDIFVIISHAFSLFVYFSIFLITISRMLKL